MNLLRRGLKSNFFYIFILAVCFSVFVFLNRSYFFQRFDSQVLNRYLRSQDIEDREDRIKDRIFISDADIYIASGYLYASGSNPIDYNLHPPLIKYLFGFSSKYFNLPLIPNIIFGFLLILEVYLLGVLAFKSKLIGLLSSIMLMFDPVMKEVSIYALLDLGQITFILGFVITTLFKPKNYLLSGILLGLSTASKFYSPVVIFLGLIYLYKLVNKQFSWQKETLSLVVAGLVFSLTYIVAIPFNIFTYQARVIKFMLDHNIAGEWGSVTPMFFGGWFVWALSFFATLYLLFKTKIKDKQFLLFLIPIFYLLVMTFQLPFTRYFILVIPFLYLNLCFLIMSKIHSLK